MLKQTHHLPLKIISTGRVTIKLYRIEVNCEVTYRFTLACDCSPEQALTLGELRLIEDAVRESIRDAEAAALDEMNLHFLTMFPKKRDG